MDCGSGKKKKLGFTQLDHNLHILMKLGIQSYDPLGSNDFMLVVIQICIVHLHHIFGLTEEKLSSKLKAIFSLVLIQIWIQHLDLFFQEEHCGFRSNLVYSVSSVGGSHHPVLIVMEIRIQSLDQGHFLPDAP